MHEYMLVDHITGQFLERCSEHAEAKSRKGVLQASRRRRVAIHKVRLPDRPIPKQLARQRNRTLQTHARLALSSDQVAHLEETRGVQRTLVEQAMGRLIDRLKFGP